MSDPEKRNIQLRLGLILEGVTVGWNVAEGIIAVIAGMGAGSVALIGFGIDSFIEVASAATVGWRLFEEMRGQSEEAVEKIETLTSRMAGGLLIALSIYIAVDAVRRLLGAGAQSRQSIGGIAIATAALVIMPLLGRAKLRAASALGSAALRTDAYETISCAWLSGATLLGLALNAALGWWWADPAAALILAPLIAREGMESLRGEKEDQCA